MHTLDYRMKPITHTALGAGAACMVLGIVFQTYATHMLRQDLFYIFEVGVKSQVYHGLGLILLGIVCAVLPYNKSFRWSTLLIITGVILFSGSWYLMALTDAKIPRLISPLGGLSLTAGWLIFTLGTLKRPHA